MKAKQEYSSKVKIWQLPKNIINIFTSKGSETMDKFEEIFDLEIQINKLNEMLLENNLAPQKRNKIIKKLKHNQRLLILAKKQD